MEKKRLKFADTVLVAATLFGMFFGAGNLIFPVHLGQLAGRNFIPAIIGFVITAVGIDVSKSKSTVAVRRPGGEIVLRPFEVHHTNSDLKKLASTLKKLGGDIRIVMEHTSTYWRPIALTL